MITARVAQNSDAEIITKFVNGAYRGESSKQGWTTEADILDGQRTDAERILEIINEKKSTLMLYHQGEELIGSVHLEILNSDTMYAGMLVVKPNTQGKGIGAYILTEIENWGRQQHLTQFKIYVLEPRTELLSYYVRKGFKLTGHFEPFPDDPRYGIPKIPNMRLLELIKKL